jgi:hypothetical protein
VNSALLVRHDVIIPDGTKNIRIMVSVYNDIVGVFFNGTRIAENILHENCPVLDEFRIDVPQELVQPGQNFVAFHLRDRGVESFFDTRILGELSDPGLSALMKNLARQSGLKLPRVPITEIVVDCAQFTRPQTTITFLINATGERGKIEIDQSLADTIIQRAWLDGHLQFTITQRGREVHYDFTEAYLTGGEGGALSRTALEDVLRRREVNAPLATCVLPTQITGQGLINEPSEDCVTTCLSSGRTSSAICTGLFAASGFIGGLCAITG